MFEVLWVFLKINSSFNLFSWHCISLCLNFLWLLFATPLFVYFHFPSIRLSYLLCLIFQDLAHGTTVVSPVQPCPLLTAQPAQYPKHQGKILFPSYWWMFPLHCSTFLISFGFYDIAVLITSKKAITLSVSKVMTYILLLAPNDISIPIFAGTAATQALQFCVPPPFMAGGHQSLAAVPNQIPILQPPFPLNRPMQVPGTNAFFNTKF